MIIGTLEDFLICLHTEKPSIFGIITSSSKISGFSFLNFCRASSPSVATIGIYPSFLAYSAKIEVICSLSSTIKTLTIKHHPQSMYYIEHPSRKSLF